MRLRNEAVSDGFCKTDKKLESKSIGNRNSMGSKIGNGYNVVLETRYDTEVGWPTYVFI